MKIAAPSASAMLAQATALWPNRLRDADGVIPSAAHTATNPTSDHEPGAAGYCHAVDLTHDPANGCDAHAIAERIRQAHDARVKYVISNRRIWNPSVSWAWRPYSGASPHTHHIHVSIKDTKAACEDTSPWPLSGAGMEDDTVKVIEGAPGRVWRLMKGEDHRWRSDAAGINAAIAGGFGFEDRAFDLHGDIPVHSLTSPAGTSLLSIDRSEIAALVAERWTDDGVIGSAGVGGAPVYRFAKGPYHMHTTSTAERAALLAWGWKDEGVGFYTGVPAPSASDPLIAAKAARYDVIASITAEPL
jgi:hypothetical protein